MTQQPHRDHRDPHPPRRVGVARRASITRAGLTAAIALALGTTSHAAACGPSDIIGIGSVGHLAEDGRLMLELTASAAPIDPLTVTLLVFVDGVLTPTGIPLDLPCDEPVVMATHATHVSHAVHWTLMHRPPVSPLFDGLAPEEVLARYADTLPPGAWPVFVDAPLLRPSDAQPFEGPLPSPVRAVEVGPDLWIEDRVVLLDDEGSVDARRLVRVPVGRPVAFRVHYTPGAAGAGPLLVTCLLDERQLPAFDGAPFRVVAVPMHHLLELDGIVTLPRPGWHRLHCLLLSDEPGREPPTLPRPLDALFLWGDG